MKIPESVRIAGVEYPVEFVEVLTEGPNVLMGQINYVEHRIRISKSVGLDHQGQCLTLLHEIMHGIVNNADLKLDDEEKVVEMFARGIYQLLQDNGKRFFDLDDGPSAEEFIDNVLKGEEK